MANSEIYLKDDSLNSWSPLSFSYISSELNNINANISGLNQKLNDNISGVNANISGLNQKLNDNISGLNQKLNDNISGVNANISGVHSAATVKRLTSSSDFTAGPAVLYGVQASTTGNASMNKVIVIKDNAQGIIKFTVPTSGAANFDFTPSVGMNFDSKITLYTTVGANQGLSVCAVYKD